MDQWNSSREEGKLVSYLITVFVPSKLLQFGTNRYAWLWLFFDGQSSFFLFRHYMWLRHGKVLVRRRNASRTPRGGFVASCSSSVYPLQTQHLRTQYLFPTQYLQTQRIRFNRDLAYVQLCSSRYLTINIVTWHLSPSLLPFIPGMSTTTYTMHITWWGLSSPQNPHSMISISDALRTLTFVLILWY
jgi:hypothetical protein